MAACCGVKYVSKKIMLQLWGRGIYIVKHYASEVKYNQKGNIVNIKFIREDDIDGDCDQLL